MSVGRSVGRSVGWLVGRLAGRSVGCWSVGRLAGRSFDWCRATPWARLKEFGLYRLCSDGRYFSRRPTC